MKKINLALVGATGLVGKSFLTVLEDRHFKNKIKNLYLFASEKSENVEVEIFGKKILVEALTEQNVLSKKIDYAFFAVEENISKIFAPIFMKNKTVVIDNSSAFRLSENVPLVVPEINFEKNNSLLIANPNCSTIQCALPLGVLQKKFGIKKIAFTTFQAVSGAGVKGLEDLYATSQGGEPKVFPYPIFNNVIPQIGSFDENGFSSEEKKMIFETQKILGRKIPISATCVRVPVENCHSIAVSVELKKKFSVDSVKKLFSGTENLVVVESKENLFPINTLANGKDEVFVGRLRQDLFNKKILHFWCVADNVRKGASANGVQILEKLLNI